MQFFLAFSLLFLFWILLSGFLDPFHLSLGAISSALVAYWSKDLLFASSEKTAVNRIRFLLKFFPYFLWLNYQILIANIQVVILALHPNLEDKLNPKIVKFKTSLKGNELAQFFLANSITLTPGTITVSVHNDEFEVHAITNEAAKALPGEMQERVEGLFS